MKSVVIYVGYNAHRERSTSDVVTGNVRQIRVLDGTGRISELLDSFPARISPEGF